MEAKIKMGQPFVLKHVYNEGLDAHAQVQPIGALIESISGAARSRAKWNPNGWTKREDVSRKWKSGSFTSENMKIVPRTGNAVNIYGCPVFLFGIIIILSLI